MKLYIKQKVFSIRDEYHIYNEFGDEYYHVKSDVLALLDRIHLYDREGRELFYIKRKMSLLGAVYEIYNKEILCAKVNQRVRFLRSQIDVNSNYGQFTINGNFFEHEYRIMNGNSCIGTVSKVYLSWGDSYEMNIENSQDPAFFTTLVIAIDNCLHKEH